jgi:hypothetical protein
MCYFVLNLIVLKLFQHPSQLFFCLKNNDILFTNNKILYIIIKKMGQTCCQDISDHNLPVAVINPIIKVNRTN